MTSNLLDISEKIDKSLADLFDVLTKATGKLGIPFFVVGATARDLVLRFYDETPARATRDVDIGIRIPNWGKFHDLRNTLLNTGEFDPTAVLHRLSSHLGLPLDIVPFGGLANEHMQLRWPNEEDRVMSVLGFEEAYESAIVMRVRRRPAIDVRVASLPGIVITKLISWFERYPERSQDALDIYLIASKYVDAGGLERLSSEAKDLIEAEEEIDIELAGARLLGRDMVAICNANTAGHIAEILANETGQRSQYRLVEAMRGRDLLGDAPKLERVLQLLETVQVGFGEGIGGEG